MEDSECEREEVDGGCEWVECAARERTTSPLQMGQVRRRVVSQGVLRRHVSEKIEGIGKRDGLHALGVELVAARETHNAALAVDVFF